MEDLIILWESLPTYIKGNNINAFAIDFRDNMYIKYFLNFCIAMCKLFRNIDPVLTIIQYPDKSIIKTDLYKVYRWFLEDKRSNTSNITREWMDTLLQLLQDTKLNRGGKKKKEERISLVKSFIKNSTLSFEATNTLLCLLFKCGDMTFKNFKYALTETSFNSKIKYVSIDNEEMIMQNKRKNIKNK